MTAQVLASELGNLIQESKRKHNDLRQASEKALEELRSLRDSSEAHIGAELSQHTNFVNPFIIACGSRNVRFTSIAIVCLQRLIAAKGVPRSRLDQVLQALREASSGGLDVQLRILQSLPTLLQNYANHVSGDLLVTALNICFVLQSSKNVVVNNTASATLQQLLIAVFDKVVSEDKAHLSSPPVGEAPAQDGKVSLHPAALDAYCIFNDVCILTESARPEVLRFSSLPQTFGLELIESVLTNHAAIFASHPEQREILRARVMPFLTTSLLAKPNFPTAVRLVRVLYTILRRHMTLLVTESGESLVALAQVLDQENLQWKRVLCMEAFKGLFSEPSIVRQIYMLYDAKNGRKNILQDLLATFVRVSTERPGVIGLGHQSTIPVAGPTGGGGSSADQVVLEASGMSGIINGSVTGEGVNTGISSAWSAIRTPCIDQLDKAEPLTIPDSYIFSLVLACITSMSEGLAKFILPLTVPSESRARKRALKQDGRADSPASAGAKDEQAMSGNGGGLERSSSFKRNPVPTNPLQLKNHPLYADVQACADLMERCWPAILATCSTFLYSALDSEYYHSLVRAFQRFTHVAGLLQLTTPRDAFLTTLGKSAVPPNVLTACLNSGPRPSTPTSAAADTPSSIFGNARGLLSVDSLVSQASSSEKPRQPSADTGSVTINTRNLLCLRALLNLGIALGSTLHDSWQIVLETLQQADFVLFCSGKTAGRVPTVVRGADPQAEAEANTLLTSFGSEVKAVEVAASRLFDSTVDFPNASFVEFVVAICGLLEKRTDSPAAAAPSDANAPSKVPNPAFDDGEGTISVAKGGRSGRRASSSSSASGLLQTPVVKHKRVMSITTALPSGHTQEDQFVLAKLGDVASVNLERLLCCPPDVSGWIPLTGELIGVLSSVSTAAEVRMRAAETFVRLILKAGSAASAIEDEARGEIQLRLLEALSDALLPMQGDDRGGGSVATHAVDIDIHKAILDGLKGLLEGSGDSLVSGWNVVFQIIDSIFMVEGDDDEQLAGYAGNIVVSSEGPKGVLATRSVRLIKSSFASLQLICSDFLPSLPNNCYLSLVDTLYKFCSQDDDLNVALTTVTFYWAISDFLLGRSKPMSISAAMGGGSTDDALVKLAYDASHPGSGAALWMLLLLRLTAVTTDQRLELRNSAVQTLLRIIHAYGNSLNAEAWSVCIRLVVFRLLSSTEGKLQGVMDKRASESVRAEWDETAVVIIDGVSELLANYMDVLVTHAVFSALWEELQGHFATMLDFQSLEVSTAVFSSLTGILAKSDGARWTLDKKAVEFVWRLWSRGVPIPMPGGEARAGAETTTAQSGTAGAETMTTPSKGRSGSAGKAARPENNQKCLVAWVNAFLELERLMRSELDLERIQRATALLLDAVMWASPGSYASDIDYMTPLQGRVLEVFKIMRTDIPGVPSVVIEQLAEFVSMAFDMRGGVPGSGSAKRTFVALSKEAMPILHHHITQNTADADMFASGALTVALKALAKPITLKYQFPVVTKTMAPWKEAVHAVLAVLETTLPHLTEPAVPRAALQEAWDAIVEIANGIISADMQDVRLDDRAIAEDQQFDMDAFRRLRELIIPLLGSAAVADRTRKVYAEGLFRISIVHAPAASAAATRVGAKGGADNDDDDSGSDGEGDDDGDNDDSLDRLYQCARGRTTDPPPTKRASTSYACLDELFALVTAHDDSCAAKPSIVVQPPTPRHAHKTMTIPPPLSALERAQAQAQTPEATVAADTEHARHVRLAVTAARYVVLRCALTLRSYIADQPLRGAMPQPLSQRRELHRILRSLVDLASEPAAMAGRRGGGGRTSGDDGSDAAAPGGRGVASDAADTHKHLLWLYPLLVQVSRVAGSAGDDKTLALVGEALDAAGIGAVRGKLAL